VVFLGNAKEQEGVLMSLDELAGKLMKDIPTQTLPQWHKISSKIQGASAEFS